MSAVPRTRASRLRPGIWASIWLIPFFAGGCRVEDRPHPHGSDEHEDRTAQRTVWSERFEVFLEHKLIAAGTPATFVTHVSDLAALEPRRSGSVKFLLRFGADPPLEHVDPEPARAGIYTPKLTFPKAGKWAVALHIHTDPGESVMPLGEFTVYASHDETHQAQTPDAPEGITFLKEQQWKLRTKTEPVLKRRMVERLRVPGRVTARPSSRASVTPPLAGRLLPPLDRELPSLGARVEAGQTLALIQPPFSDFLVKLVESEAEVIRTKLDVELAELADSRVQKLAGQQLKTAREREEADFALRAAKANHESARSLQAAYRNAGAFLTARSSTEGTPGGLPSLELKAPIGGVVSQVTATAGEHVPADRAVFAVLDPEWVHVEAKVPEGDLDRVASPRAAWPGGAAYELPHAPGEFHPLLADGAGRVVFFGLEVDPATRSVPLVYEVKNSSGRLRIGQALNVFLETARSEEALAVPESAVVDEEGRPVAFIQVSGETFEKRHLTLGLRESGFVEIRSGLSAGERVVTKEAYAVRLASVSSSIPAHGHAH